MNMKQIVNSLKNFRLKLQESIGEFRELLGELTLFVLLLLSILSAFQEALSNVTVL